MRRVLVAIGGNSLTRFNQVGTIEEQFANTAETCRHLAGIVERGWEIVLTHGNGPQVGNLMRRVELSAHETYRLPLDICDAHTQGGMGYMLQQVLGNELRRRGIQRKIATFVTQVCVDAADPAFENPTKPVGVYYSEAEARARAAEMGWSIVNDAGRGWRRVVPSPMPLRIVESPAIKACVDKVIPIAAGGGGIPVVEKDGDFFGVEAVIDKDRASALLARDLDCDLFIILTAVADVQLYYGTEKSEHLRDVSRGDLRRWLAAGEFPPGSMGPKVEAVLHYLDHGGKEAIITDPEHLDAALEGRAGTRIV